MVSSARKNTSPGGDSLYPLSTADIAREIGVSREMVQRMVRQGKWPAAQIPARGSNGYAYRFSHEDLGAIIRMLRRDRRAS